jgi:hypothetical protein
LFGFEKKRQEIHLVISDESREKNVILKYRTQKERVERAVKKLTFPVSKAFVRVSTTSS